MISWGTTAFNKDWSPWSQSYVYSQAMVAAELSQCLNTTKHVPSAPVYTTSFINMMEFPFLTSLKETTLLIFSITINHHLHDYP
jgi:hypothetical protein